MLIERVFWLYKARLVACAAGGNCAQEHLDDWANRLRENRNSAAASKAGGCSFCQGRPFSYCFSHMGRHMGLFSTCAIYKCTAPGCSVDLPPVPGMRKTFIPGWEGLAKVQMAHLVGKEPRVGAGWCGGQGGDCAGLPL
jgi:hypothetical protein